MDARQPAPPSTRPPDRHLIHNPNHQPPTAHAYPGYPPSTQPQQPQQPQQPLHVPFATSTDPYATSRRDPFLPQASHHARQRSHGAPEGASQAHTERNGGWGNTVRNHGSLSYGAHSMHPQSGPPSQPSMSASGPPSGPSPYAFDAARRRSLNAPSHEPPSFARPQMPPPSSPPQQQTHPSQSQRPPYASNFGASRELPGLGQAHRPGSSMSISSLIGGGDAGASAQASQSQTSPPTNASLPNNHSMQPPSPRRAFPSGARSDFAPFRRQPSPDRSMHGSNASRASEGHNFSAGSPPTRPYSNHGSPNLGQQSLPPSHQAYKPSVFPSQGLFGPSPNDPLARDARQPPGSVPPRPNSQPNGPAGPAGREGASLYDALRGRRSAYGPPEERRRTLGEQSRPDAAELLRGIGQGVTDRNRPVTVHPVSQSAFDPPREQHGATASNEPSRSLWQPSAPSEPSREPAETHREEPSALYRSYGTYPPPVPGPPRYGPPTLSEMAPRRSLDQLNNRVVEQYHAPPTSDPNSKERHQTEPLTRSFSSGGSSYPGRSMYGMGEPMQHSKSHIGLGLEESRRTGRASPLPQAVQGAQAPPFMTGKDPGIKSEFGRMFSGLGGLGSSTPLRGSPLPQNGQDGQELGEMMRRISSQQGRKPKRVKDESNVFDDDSNDGRGTPTGVRGTKRNKHAHPLGHHHHHAPHHHHHHHHHHHNDDLASTASATVSGRQSSLPQSGPAQPVHHHHHVQGTPHHHHHHHTPRVAPLTAKLPPKVHDVQPVLEEAAKLPRRHLGSHVYEATTDLPRPNSSLDDQFGYASKPNRLPRFEINPINCTFTIRVPRFYLRPRQRQHIVLERHLWGARVYRDDSDPIAAAIHSGWIRGEWDDTVDVSMLDPRITAPNDPSDAEDTLNKVPAAPVTPPADMDLQIEILILPQLQEYTCSVEYGISSRQSRGHDGLSFMINKIRWVEEGIGSRGQERTAAALKRRLDASATLLALMNGGDDLHRVNGMAKLHA
ncbi:Rxt3-domain-containing protein [Macroventuria anomochaeta]|uniref:Rxt3-domain-containing protein n=1 Tax=Macroventuria anomochaeta TaxID=301207 RepID=A0ACB6RMW7_9PLEO|nr:Rxt3-domain-containing protein [Macroventuria anomochaeta]KAF2622647.1 Rxt3-domain-containing protein [Macroventuria anomochaeta]